MEVIRLINSLSSKANPLVAGGAPRDWDRNFPATDVDIWLQAWKLGPLFKALRKRYTVKCTSPYVAGNEKKYIKAVYDVYINDTIINLVFVHDPRPEEVIGRFCCTLSEAVWCYRTDTILLSPNYVHSRLNNCYTIYNGNDPNRRPSEHYIEKMRQKFPYYREIIET